MDVRKDGEDIVITLDTATAKKLASQLTDLDGEMRNGARALGSVLTQAIYEKNDEFRQPPHAFDENAPQQPTIET